MPYSFLIPFPHNKMVTRLYYVTKGAGGNRYTSVKQLLVIKAINDTVFTTREVLLE